MRHFKRFTNDYRRYTPTLLTIAAISAAFFLFATNAAAADRAPEPQQSVVSDRDIQSAIDAKIDQAAIDRQAIQVMLQRDDVRSVAGSAGLDLERASAAAAVLSGPSLEKLAAQAQTVNAGGLAGGEGSVVITTTGIIIILLVLILLTS